MISLTVVTEGTVVIIIIVRTTTRAISNALSFGDITNAVAISVALKGDKFSVRSETVDQFLRVIAGMDNLHHYKDRLWCRRCCSRTFHPGEEEVEVEVDRHHHHQEQLLGQLHRSLHHHLCRNKEDHLRNCCRLQIEQSQLPLGEATF